MAETVDSKILLDLYDRADRLRPLLEGASDQDEAVERDSPFMKEEESADQGASGEVRSSCDALAIGGRVSCPVSYSLAHAVPSFADAFDCFWSGAVAPVAHTYTVNKFWKACGRAHTMKLAPKCTFQAAQLRDAVVSAGELFQTCFVVIGK